MSVAYIDDNQECLLIVQSAFDQLNITVDIYNDPIEFYQKNIEYKVIISDYHMPNLNGEDFLKLAMEKWPKTKVILYSGIIEQAPKDYLKIHSFLSKPADFESLLKVVRYLSFEFDKEVKAS